jgi:hypothetical protein
MNDPARLELIHADVDGELDGAQRAELARILLADPDARTLHDDLRRVSAALDALPAVEPPRELLPGILAALPAQPPARARPAWVEHRWRYAALLAGVIAAGAIVFQTGRGPGSDTGEMSGTLAAGPMILDTATLPPGGELSGRVILYRDTAGFGLRFQLEASGPVNASISSGGRTLEVRDLRAGAGRPTRTVPLPTLTPGQEVDVVLTMGGRGATHVSLRAP